jgi:hypothetical protein
MKKTAILASIIGMLSSPMILAIEPVIGSGEVVTEQRNIGTVDVLELSGTGTLTIERSSDESGLWIEAEDNVIPYIVSDLDANGVLRIGFDDSKELHPVYPIHYRLKVSDVQRIHLEGNTTLEMMPGFKTNEMRFEITDAATALVDIEAQSLDWHLEGSGMVKASGSVGTQKVKTAGKASFQGAELKSTSASVAAHDESNLDLFVDKELSIAAGESATVAYHGKPALKKALRDNATVKAS